MQVSVESVSKIERRITIVVPPEKLDAAFDQRLVKLSKTVNIKGFRKGKVPLNVIKTHYGDTAMQEAMSEVIQASLYDAIHKEKLNPVGVPMVEPKTVLAGQPLEFVATFEVAPEIETVHFKIEQIEKLHVNIQDTDITRVIDHLRGQHTTWNKVTRPAKLNDQVVIDFLGTIDGKAFSGGQAHDYPIVIGSKMMVPGFEEGLIGLNADEDKVVPVTFAENYFAKEVAGKAAEFQVHVISISEPNVPAADDKFIKKLGVKSGLIEDLHAEIRRNLERERDRIIKTKLKQTVFDKLIEQNAIDVPKSMIEREAKRIHDELHPHHHNDPNHKHSEAENANFQQAAKRNVALGLLIGHLIKHYQIKVDQNRVDAHINTLASAYQDPQQVSEWYKKNKQQLAEVELLVMEEQVMEKLIETVKVNQKEITYLELTKATH